MSEFKNLPEWALEIARHCEGDYEYALLITTIWDWMEQLLQAYDEALGEIERLEKIATEHSWCNSEERMGR